LTRKKGVVVLNPPYGKRIGTPKEVHAFFTRIGTHLKEKFPGWQAGIVLPDKGLVSTLPFSASLTPVFHGGLEIFIATGKIR
ncbi:MAG: RNA methyltransferase, partial [Desulfobacteraceae bacterium]